MTSPRAALVLVVLVATVAGDQPGLAGEPPGRPEGMEPQRLPWSGPKAPWLQRRRSGVEDLEPSGYGLVDPGQWPAEPALPADIAPEALAKVLRPQCDWMPPSRPLRYAKWILEASAHFGVDPLVVAGLITTQSRCRPDLETDFGLGLSQIHPKTHLTHLRHKRYQYKVWADGAWDPRELDISAHLFYPRALKSAEANIYFTAALLRIATEQCPANDGAWGSIPHRHPVSHVIWGDRVRGTDDEDLVLLARRRMIEALTGTRADLRSAWGDLELVSPLDGAPRKLTSGVGDERDDGARRHQGVDFASTHGEPVRAVADGVVEFAGAFGRNVPPDKLDTLEGRALGKAGIYVKIDHGGGKVSAYMHLKDLTVVKGQPVHAGDLIGHVGRTGIKASPAHLHFELRLDGDRVDPAPHLGALAFPPEAGWRGLRLDYERKKGRR